MLRDVPARWELNARVSSAYAYARSTRAFPPSYASDARQLVQLATSRDDREVNAREGRGEGGKSSSTRRLFAADIAETDKFA